MLLHGPQRPCQTPGCPRGAPTQHLLFSSDRVSVCLLIGQLRVWGAGRRFWGEQKPGKDCFEAQAPPGDVIKAPASSQEKLQTLTPHVHLWDTARGPQVEKLWPEQVMATMEGIKSSPKLGQMGPACDGHTLTPARTSPGSQLGCSSERWRGYQRPLPSAGASVEGPIQAQPACPPGSSVTVMETEGQWAGATHVRPLHLLETLAGAVGDVAEQILEYLVQ